MNRETKKHAAFDQILPSIRCSFAVFGELYRESYLREIFEERFLRRSFFANPLIMSRFTAKAKFFVTNRDFRDIIFFCKKIEFSKSFQRRGSWQMSSPLHTAGCTVSVRRVNSGPKFDKIGLSRPRPHLGRSCVFKEEYVHKHARPQYHPACNDG